MRFAVLPFLFSGCAQDEMANNAGNRTTAEVSDVGAMAPAPPEEVVLTATSIVPGPVGHHYVGEFVLINNSSFPAVIPAFPFRSGGHVSPALVGFEIEKEGQWEQLDVGYDVTPMNVSVPSGGRLLLHVDLSPIKKKPEASTARISIGAYKSEPFTLDWPGDLARGEFAAARAEHLARMRMLLRRAGFRESFLKGNDFCERLLNTMFSPLRKNVLGFDRFNGDMDFVFMDDVDGNIRLSFHGSVIIGYEYQYDGMLVLNPATFTPNWFRGIRGANIKIGVWGDARAMYFGDESGFNASENVLYIELKYRTLGVRPLPSDGEARSLLLRMLARIDPLLE